MGFFGWKNRYTVQLEKSTTAVSYAKHCKWRSSQRITEGFVQRSEDRIPFGLEAARGNHTVIDFEVNVCQFKVIFKEKYMQAKLARLVLQIATTAR
jgi:hypothetical protein